jgi:hypothetical protein
MLTYRSKSLANQHEILTDTRVRKRIERVQKDTESLIATVDSASFMSRSTGTSSRLSALFDFDEQLFTTRPYKAMIRRTVKLSVRSQPHQMTNSTAQFTTSISSNSPVFAGRRSNSASDVHAQASQEPRSFFNVLLLGMFDNSEVYLVVTNNMKVQGNLLRLHFSNRSSPSIIPPHFWETKKYGEASFTKILRLSSRHSTEATSNAAHLTSKAS